MLRLAALLLAIPIAILPAIGQSMPAIGTIDYYGVHRVSKTALTRALRIVPGDRPTKALETEGKRLDSVPGVSRARLNFVCCDARGKTILYVGIEETGGTQFHFRPAPVGSERLPAEVVQAGHALDEAVMQAAEKGQASEDDSQGYTLFKYPAAPAIQERFVVFAARDFPLLRSVLRNSSDAGQRALAAEVIGYSANHAAAVPMLEYAMSDPNSDVRNNAMRALAIIARYAGKHPALRIRIPPEPFIRLLDSLQWTDRDKAGFALMALTESRDPKLLAELRRRELSSLVEMARWHTPGHADMFCVLLGRIAGIPDKVIWSDLQNDQKEKIITAALNSARHPAHPAGSTSQ